jgi:hypothetical protein
LSDPNFPGYPPQYVVPDQSSSTGVKFAILFGAVIALLGANVYLFIQIDRLKQEQASSREAFLDEVGRVRETQTASTTAAARNLATLRTQLDDARRQANQAAGDAKVEATKRAEELAAQLAAQQKAAEQAVRSEISKVEQSAASRIGEVSSEVSTVRTEVSSAKSEIDKTIADLKTVRGDLGVQSGLIATNAKELSALRALGERNYIEFNLKRTKVPQRVGDIMIQLKRTDARRSRYTIDITADDKTVEKKDRTVNEPVQFYTLRARQPYELVVNNVGRDVIQGYLSTPKVQAAR